jgi:hypothetical protein
VALNEEHRLGVFENKMLRIVLGPKREETMGIGRKMRDEELHII